MTLGLVETQAAPKDGPPCASSDIQSGILTVLMPLQRFTVRAKPEIDEFLTTGPSLRILCQEHSGKERLHAEPARAQPVWKTLFPERHEAVIITVSVGPTAEDP